MSEIVERAARHVASLNGHSDDWERYIEEARDYVNFVIEECARIAEERPPRTSIADGDETEAYFLALDDAAAAIRALKSGGDE